jgi:16S rRNA (uracil1498-N3)-methyltransferase
LSDPLPLLHQPITAPEPLAPGRAWPITSIDRERLQFRGVRPGEAFTVRDATGAWFRARFDSPDAFSATAFEVILCPESPLRLALFQAVLARERMFWVVQKATELGVHGIVPVFTARSLGPHDLEREKAHRWPAAILRAVKQCRRGTIPVLSPAVPLADALALPAWGRADLRWSMQERAIHRGGAEDAEEERGGGRSLTVNARVDSPKMGSAALAVGPEGGWAGEEAELLAAAGAIPITLGGRILRAETAALVGLTLLQREHGD